MTEPERAALDHIRQVVDSVIGVPAIPDSLPLIPDTLPAQVNASILPVPYISLLGAGDDQIIYDLGAATGAMLVSAYTDQAIRPIDFYKQTVQDEEAPLSFAQISNAMRALGVPAEFRSHLKLADLSLILFSGRPAIALVDQAVLHDAGLTPEIFTGPHFLVVVGMDVKQAYIHDPLRKDGSGQAQAIPWLVFYQAWTQAQGDERAVLVPRLQLVRRVRVTADLLEIHLQPDATAPLTGTVGLGNFFEITTQKNGWGKIGEDRWISLKDTADI